jgi:hypothetical protein
VVFDVAGGAGVLVAGAGRALAGDPGTDTGVGTVATAAGAALAAADGGGSGSVSGGR